MAERAAGYDWSATPLGPLDQWPQTLKAALQIVMNSRFPMFIWWGPQLINIYNDAYIPMLGKKHPEGFARPASEVWHEIWDVVGAQAELVIKYRQATWNDEMLLLMERHGYTEETYFTWSYSPVGAGASEAEGLFCAVTEDTSEVIGRRRLKTLRELATETADLRTGPAVFAAGANVLSRNPYDIPFALLYEADEQGNMARLAGAAGVDGARCGAPLCTGLDANDNPWRVDLLSDQIRMIEDLDKCFTAVPEGPWPVRPVQALFLPFTRGAETRSSGFMIAGISPYIRLDEEYRGFLALAAGHIATALANSRAYESERRRAEALAEIDRAKTAFFSNVSHEFRTPLTLMIGPLEEMLAEAVTLAPDHRERLDTAHRNSLRLLKLVNTLLDFARIEAGRVQAAYEATDLGALTKEVASVFRSAIEKAGLGFVVDTPPLPEPVYVDCEMWEKIILNLLSNAFKFTFAGEIGVSLRAAEGMARLVVSDTGIGIPAGEIPRLFERFHRVKGARGRSFEGSGIGLALVQELVKLHGGSIHVESEVDRGTRFTVSIPMGKAHLPADRIGAAGIRQSAPAGAGAFLEEAVRWLPEGGEHPVAAPEEPVPSRAPSAAVRPRIVLADDNADMRAYAERLLARDYDVTVVADGEAALDAIRKNPPDLVLSDVMMPRLDGFGLVRALRQDPHTQEIPMILLTARAGEEERVEGLETGADEYLTKPFSARELLARVQASLKLQRVRGESNRALRESEKRLSRFVNALTRLHDVSRELSAAANENDGLPCILKGMVDLHRTTRGAIFLCDPLGRTLSSAGAIGFDDSIPHDASARLALEQNRVVIVEDTEDEPEYERWRDAAREAGFRAVTSIPVRDRSGSCLAIVSVYFPSAHRPDELQTQLADMHSLQAADFIERLRAGHALRESEYQYRTLFNSMDEGFCTIEVLFNGNEQGVDFRFVDFNSAFEKQTGLQNPRGRRMREIAPAHEENWFDIFGRIALTGRPERFENEARQLGRWYEGYAFRLDPPELHRVGIIFNDITERRRREEQLRQANSDLEQFAYSASHDLQEPIRTVSIYSEILAKRYGDRLDPEGIQFLGYIRAGGERMGMLVRDLLAYTRVVKLDAEPEVADSNEAFRIALSNLDAAIRSSEARILAGPLPTVLAHPMHLQQLFQNLISNAIKYRSKDRNPVIEVTAEQCEGQWLFSIVDNGIGIAPEFQNKIFGLFKRLHSGSEYAGTGLGLAICQRIVERYGGRIWVESEGGRGATFRFTLPA